MLPLRLVLDTNIIVSAVLKPDGLQRTVLLISTAKPARFYVMSLIVKEYAYVLFRPELHIPRGTQQQMLQLIKDRARMALPLYQLHVTTDPDDNIVLECADAAKADYLVTGNQRHFPKFGKRTEIITSREFVTMMAPHLAQ